MSGDVTSITEHNGIRILAPSGSRSARFASYNAPDSFEPHTALPNVLKLEESIPEATQDKLKIKGHIIEKWPDQIWKAGAVCAIIKKPNRHILLGAADPRRPCLALGR